MYNTLVGSVVGNYMLQNITLVGLIEMNSEDVKWIDLAHYTVQLRAFVNTVMNFRLP